MENNTNSAKKWKTIAIAAILVAVIALGSLFVTMTKAGAGAQTPAATQTTAEAQTEAQGAAETETEAATETQAAEAQTEAEPAAEPAAEAEVQAVDANEMLNLWNEDAEARKQLTAYMDTITKEGSPDFIPVENRIAVFDFDGTLFCETDPNYFDYTLLVYRVTEDPEYKDQASEFEKSVAAKIIDQNTNGTKYEELPMEHGQAVASAFKGMTMDEFLAMLQIINYLKANDFTVYVISGTDRFICRGIMMNSPLELPNSQIIGSDETVVAGLQNGEDGLNYTFTQGDDLYLGGEFIIKNLKMNKVSVINREIGVQPVLSFGNTTGDAAMCNYALSDNQYKSLAFMLCCDDLERENGNIDKANKMYTLCEENNWIPVSMKNDWKTIYAEGVKYLGKQAAEPAEEQPAAEQTEAPAEEQTEAPAAEQPAEEQTETPAEETEEALDNAA